MTNILNDDSPDNVFMQVIKDICPIGQEVSESEVMDAFFAVLEKEDQRGAQSILKRFELEGIIKRRHGLSLSLIEEPSQLEV